MEFSSNQDRPNHCTFSRVNLKLTCSINVFYLCFACISSVLLFVCICIILRFFFFSAVMFARALYKCRVALSRVSIFTHVDPYKFILQYHCGYGKLWYLRVLRGCSAATPCTVAPVTLAAEYHPTVSESTKVLQLTISSTVHCS